VIYLGIDCGTQSTKTVALDGDTGKIVASAAQHYDVLPGLPTGYMEQHPATWTQAVDVTIHEAWGPVEKTCTVSAFPASNMGLFPWINNRE
jgi:xylulokinase